MNAAASLFSADNPGLPALGLVQLWLHLGWGTLLAWLGVRMGTRLGLQPRAAWVLASALMVWAWLPGPYAPVHWLGLAFQGPSVMAVLLCAVDLVWRRTGSGRFREGPSFWSGAWLAAGVLLGWALLLDTLALLPVSLYAWGFNAAVPALLVLLALLPWVLQGGSARQHSMSVLVVAVLGVYVALHLPTGNVWDALLDPWLWLYLNVRAVRAGFAGRRGVLP